VRRRLNRVCCKERRRPRDSESQLEYEHALIDLSAAQRCAGNRIDAREPLRHGRALAQQRGASALAERARIELAATGARPRKTLLTGVDSSAKTQLRGALYAACSACTRASSGRAGLILPSAR
jgi:hypothetical protein